MTTVLAWLDHLCLTIGMAANLAYLHRVHKKVNGHADRDAAERPPQN